MDKILKQIKSDKEQAAQQNSVKSLKDQMHDAIIKIKVILLLWDKSYNNSIKTFNFKKHSETISEKEITQCHNDLMAACERDLKKLKQILENQKNKDEQERLKKIQEEILKAQREKVEEENLKILEEQHKKQY